MAQKQVTEEAQITVDAGPGQISLNTLSYLAKVLQNISKGDFASPLDTSQLGEATEVIPALKDLQENLAKLASDILQNAKSFTYSSKELNNTSKTMLENAATVNSSIVNVANLTQEMSANMNNVSAATEELSVNMKAITHNSDRSRENVTQIANATSELTSASQEIAKNTEKAREVSNRAVQKVAEANQRVSDLERAAAEINDVTSTISEISDQTKLLALNATIEAARAGEAGRGFAVVASEVKDLASQTNLATKNIQGKISVIQTATKTTIEVIDTISKVMEDVNQIVEAIAAAAEEQSATTQNVAKNIHDTTELIKDMTGSVSEGSLAVQDINKNIIDAANLARDVASAIDKVKQDTQIIKESATVVYAYAMESSSVSDDLNKRINMLSIPPKMLSAITDTEPVLFKFSEAYTVKIQSVDDQHEVIFNYINSIHNSIKNRGSREEIRKTLNDLAQFTIKHFAHEEDMMTTHNYPEYTEHKRIHTSLLVKVKEIVDKMNAGEEVDLISVMIFLKDWLQVHILKIDRKYMPFLNERGIH